MVIDPLSRTVMRLAPDVGDVSDGELVRCFAKSRDEQAFAALVRRHGPMVFSVCRRTLGHVHDAEDAFQATFLVLARKANAVRPDGVSRWLYGVAVRVANKARVRRSRRRMASLELDQFAIRDVPEVADWLPLLDTLLNNLPERDRDPIVLCDVQGRSRTEAAAALGIAEGTLSSRLARAREKLRSKLTLRGVTPSMAALTLGLTAEPVPARLLNSAFANQLPTNLAQQLAEGVLRNMILLKTCKLGLMLASVIGIGTVSFLQTGGSGADPQPAKKEVVKEAPPAKETPQVKLPPILPSTTQSKRIRDLQQERVQALEEQIQGQFERVKIGKDPLIQFIDAVRELASAEMELAIPAEQIAVMERLLKRLQVCEIEMTNLQSVGLQTKQGVAQAKAARLKAEIELEKLKAAK